MPTDATGTPTTLGIPTFNTSVDAPSGLGFNAAMATIDTLIGGRMVAPTTPADGDVPVWNAGTSTWVKSSSKAFTINIADGSLAIAKLAGYPADGTKVLKGDGTWGVATNSFTPYDSNVTAVDVTSSVAETTIYTKDIAANAMGANGWLRLLLSGDLLYNSANAVITAKIKFGATTLFAASFSHTTVGAARAPWWWEIHLRNLGATNSQRMYALFNSAADNGVAATTGLGEFGFVAGGQYASAGSPQSGTSAEDTTALKTLAVTIQWGTSSAALSFRKQTAELSLLARS